jgi:hypothetical protein
VYIDDLFIAARDPGEIIREPSETHQFNLKGVGLLTYHLGCDYFCEKNVALCYGPRKYIIKLIDQYENMFGCKTCKYTSPSEKGDHPEIDQTEELDNYGIKQN